MNLKSMRVDNKTYTSHLNNELIELQLAKEGRNIQENTQIMDHFNLVNIRLFVR